mmetsp:Transcript_21388/g.44525  ORF Transcript_21388/g.44525 Transcript_21388/m.44525 type:complete len:315 (+) Transcript_21388:105-1049(+)|eukprot:CAMPEP_0118665324 /NCGR_PEP_ID=MMETSP0785-20121206/18555_1 /TAXON_ID=91992 /ORGANISM="Bolidomonas pacifica, Strain CCMP 1866" /LENGTH=314 /DNA_ID=CAMNT_0006559429 /DNA_START=38 /DNA_END=982 /DNA_ORIENTATION=-
MSINVPKFNLSAIQRLPKPVLALGCYMLWDTVKNLALDNIFPKDLSGSIAVITGGGSGIGRGVAVKLASMGVKVALWDLNVQGMEETLKMIEKVGGKGAIYKVNVCDKELVYATAKKVTSDLGNCTILINNAGIVTGKSILDVEDSKASLTLDVNTESHFWTVKAFLPYMIENDHGHVVTIASAAGLVGVAGLCDYCASKFGARGFNEALRLELRKMGKYGVNTLVVCPYFINTGMFDGVMTRFPLGFLLPILEPEYVVHKIVQGMRRRRTELRLPRLMYVSDLLHFVFPTYIKDFIFELVGFSDSMDSFRQTR